MKRRMFSIVISLFLMFALVPLAPQASAADTVSVYFPPVFNYEDTKPFAEGISFVKKDGMWGAVNTEIKTVIPFEYEDVDAFSEGLVAVKKDGLWGYIDNTGKTVLPFEYMEAGPFSEDLAAVMVENDTWGYIDKSGTFVISGINATQAGMFFEGTAMVCDIYSITKTLWKTPYSVTSIKLIDKEGKELRSVDYAEYDLGSHLVRTIRGNKLSLGSLWQKEGYAIVRLYREYSVNSYSISSEYLHYYVSLRNDNESSIPSNTYGHAKNFSEGYALVSAGYIDTKCNLILSFDKLGLNFGGNFVGGLAPVNVRYTDGSNHEYSWGYIDKNGNTIVDFQYDDARDFGEGYAWVKSGDKWGLLYYGELTFEPLPNKTSSWAEGEITVAERLGLIPDCLKDPDIDYTQPITRTEFAAVSVKTYEALSGVKAIPAVNNPFTDTNDIEVLKAYNVGITTGVANDKFAPDDLLTREQAATMLTRVFKKVSLAGWTIQSDSQFTLPYTKPEAFSDDARISEWAKDSVYFMAANSIIQGNNGNFMPRAVTDEEAARGYAQATREQALAIAIRMVQSLS